VDLLQGYVAVQEGPVKVVLGRQKMQLGAGRYMSTLEWAPYSRAFDGLSANWSMENADLTAFTFLVKDSISNTGAGVQTAVATGDRLLLTGLHYNRKIGDNLTVEFSAFNDNSNLRTIVGADTTMSYNLYYLGQRTQGKQNQHSQCKHTTAARLAAEVSPLNTCGHVGCRRRWRGAWSRCRGCGWDWCIGSSCSRNWGIG
jgi:hypothetical protein